MSVLIKDMPMPTDCNECRFLGTGYGGQWWCFAFNCHVSVYDGKRNENCQLEEVPDPINIKQIESFISGDLMRKAQSPQWQKEHKALGFYSPLADFYEMIEGEDNEHTD